MLENRKLQISESEDMDLLSLLKRLEAFDSKQNESQVYSLKTDRGTEFVRGILTQSLSNCYENTRKVETAEDGLSRKINQAQKLLCKETGGVILSEEDIAIPFFNEKGHKTRLFEYWSSRGALYYIFSDTFMSTEECLQVLDTEYLSLKQGLYILSADSFTIRQKIAYADYLKNFFLTIYHAYTYPERFGMTLDSEATKLKKVLRQASEEFTRVYYRLLLGYSVDYVYIRNEFEFVELNWSAVIQRLMSNDLFESNWLKYPELDNPIIILRATFSFIQEDGDIDAVIGIESGGTELCYVTKFLYQLTQKTRFIDTILLPLSRYTLQKSSLYTGKEATAVLLEELLKQANLKNKKILVVDDNSNTGGSAQLMFDVLQIYKPKSLRIRVAEFDMHRSMFKHLNWDTPPDYIAHPDIFTCSVGITPITQGLDEYMPFRQQRKIIRLKILQEYFQSQLTITKSVQLSLSPKNITPDCKICGVHNIPDFITCWNEGVEWFGIHCLYDSKQYDKKVKKLSRAHLLEYKMNLDFTVGENTGLSLAEVSSIRAMLTTIRDAGIEPRIVFLVDGQNESTIPALFKHVIPADFTLPIYFQLQNKYSSKTVTSVLKQVHSLYDSNVGIIQTFGSNEDESVLHEIDADERIDFVLLDYRQLGGSGKTIDKSTLRSLINILTKQFFIAGGIGTYNVKEYINNVSDITSDFMVDLESSIEYKDKKGLQGDGESNPIIVRKSPTKVRLFTAAWKATLDTLAHVREYESLDLEGSYFKNELNRAWHDSKDKYGFYAITPTVETYLSQAYSKNLQRKNVEIAISGLLEYDFVPSYYWHRPLRGRYSRGQKTPWIIKYTPDFLKAISAYVREYGMRLYIWTAGEHQLDAAKEYVYRDEQKLKFAKSGLQELFRSNKIETYTFLASPMKLKLFQKELDSLSKDMEIVVVDDRLGNLDAAVIILKQNNFTNYKSILISQEAKADGHIICKNVVAALDYITQPSNTVLFCDMDGVLIHEEFRNEHQPKNLYFTLRKLHKFEMGAQVYGQRQSPLRINHDRLNQIQTNNPLIILGVSNLLDVSIAQLLDTCKEPLHVIPRLLTDRTQLTQRKTNRYINTQSFIDLIAQEEFAEYSFTPSGYQGTLFDDICQSFKASIPSLLVVDIDTALLMTKVFSAQNIVSRSVLMLPEDGPENRLIKHKKDMFDYVVNKDYRKISKVLETIVKGGKL